MLLYVKYNDYHIIVYVIYEFIMIYPGIID